MSDNERVYAMLLTVLLGWIAVLGAPFLIWRARRRTPQERTVLARSVLGIGVFGLWWLDAVVVVRAFDVEDNQTVPSLVWAGGFLVLVYLALTPWRGGQWKEALAGTLALAGTAFGVIGVPWHQDKRAVLDVERIAGQPLSTVQTVMADYEVDVYVAGSDQRLPLAHDARVRDLDLEALEPTQLVFYPALGGCSVWIDSGHVVKIYFNYD